MYIYRKCGTDVRVQSTTLASGSCASETETKSGQRSRIKKPTKMARKGNWETSDKLSRLEGLISHENRNSSDIPVPMVQPATGIEQQIR